MVKNMLDVVVGGMGFWMIGYGIGFGHNDHFAGTFMGGSKFFMDSSLDQATEFAKFIFQMAFATTATTIVSGRLSCKILQKVTIQS